MWKISRIDTVSILEIFHDPITPPKSVIYSSHFRNLKIYFWAKKPNPELGKKPNPELGKKINELRTVTRCEKFPGSTPCRFWKFFTIRSPPLKPSSTQVILTTQVSLEFKSFGCEFQKIGNYTRLWSSCDLWWGGESGKCLATKTTPHHLPSDKNNGWKNILTTKTVIGIWSAQLRYSMGHLEENCAQTLSRPLFAPLQLHAKNG